MKLFLITLSLISLTATGTPTKVVRVTDGDTAVVDSGALQADIRIACIDAPEVPRTVQDKARKDAVAITQYRLGQLAKSRIAQLVKESGGQVAIARIAVDQYGRNIVSAQFTAGDWGEILLQEGLAVVYTPNPKQCDVKRLKELEAIAKSQGLGIWAVADGSWVAPSVFRKK